MAVTARRGAAVSGPWRRRARCVAPRLGNLMKFAGELPSGTGQVWLMLKKWKREMDAKYMP